MGTPLGHKYILYSYMDPLGNLEVLLGFFESQGLHFFQQRAATAGARGMMPQH